MKQIIAFLILLVPYIGRRRIDINRDGSLVDTGMFNLSDERGYYYVKPWVFEWLIFGFPLSKSHVYLSSDDSIVTDHNISMAGRSD